MRSRSNHIPGRGHEAEGEQPPADSAFSHAAPDSGPGGGPNGQHGQTGDLGPGAGPQPAPASGPSSRHGLKNWRVRSRLLLLITIPTLTAVALGGFRITSSVQSALADQRTLQLANLSGDITTLANPDIVEQIREQVQGRARGPVQEGPEDIKMFGEER